MIDISNKVFDFYKYRIKLMENGIEYISYTNDIESYIRAVESNIHVRILETNVFTPTKSQLERLEALDKNINVSDSAYWISDINQFVEYGFIDPDTISVLRSMVDEYTESSRSYILNQKNNELSEYRYRKEISGIVFDNNEISTDRDNRSTMNYLLKTLELGFLNSICFKTGSKWVEYTLDGFMGLMEAISIYIENCYLAERIVFDNLNNMSLNELLSKNEDGTDFINIENMFEEAYISLINQN